MLPQQVSQQRAFNNHCLGSRAGVILDYSPRQNKITMLNIGSGGSKIEMSRNILFPVPGEGRNLEKNPSCRLESKLEKQLKISGQMQEAKVEITTPETLRGFSMMFGDFRRCSMIFSDFRRCSMIFGDFRRCSMIFGDVLRCSTIFGDFL